MFVLKRHCLAFIACALFAGCSFTAPDEPSKQLSREDIRRNTEDDRAELMRLARDLVRIELVINDEVVRTGPIIIADDEGTQKFKQFLKQATVIGPNDGSQYSTNDWPGYITIIDGKLTERRIHFLEGGTLMWFFDDRRSMGSLPPECSDFIEEAAAAHEKAHPENVIAQQH